MSEKYKVGLSRNRLFEFDNAVVFCGRLQGYAFEEYAKALKVLALKEPMITSKAVLSDDGECFVETDAVEPAFLVSELTADEVKKELSDNGVDFTKGLFSFILTSDGYMIISAHTLVADCKSLLRLAMAFASICKSKTTSVNPSRIDTFCDMASLPMEVNSPLTDKLSAELDNKWQKKSRSFTSDDYNRAKLKYSDKRNYSDEIKIELNETQTVGLKDFCSENKVDLSSVVAFCFYKELSDLVKPQKKHGKLCIHADRRLFLADAEDVSVGPFNGFCESYLGKKEQGLGLNEQIKAFHLSCYKGVTSPFKTFYDEVLLMKVSSSFCDSAYMHLAGLVNDKASKKLAYNYGCCNNQLCEFFSCNLEQNYWSGLKSFDDVSVTEPLKNRFCANVSLLVADGKCRIIVKFNNSRLALGQSESVVEGVKSLLTKIK